MDKNFAYQERKINSGTAWILFLFVGWSYGSFGKIGLQILFYLTLGGFGIWTLVRLFTLSGAIKDHNRKIAMELGFDNQELVALGLV